MRAYHAYFGKLCMSDQGRHIFYEFLCKCDLFTSRFKVPRLTGIFTEEKFGDNRQSIGESIVEAVYSDTV